MDRRRGRMENFTIKEPREYNELLQMLKSTDPNHADTFNALFEQLILKKIFREVKRNSNAECCRTYECRG